MQPRRSLRAAGGGALNQFRIPRASLTCRFRPMPHRLRHHFHATPIPSAVKPGKDENTSGPPSAAREVLNTHLRPAGADRDSLRLTHISPMFTTLSRSRASPAWAAFVRRSADPHDMSNWLRDPLTDAHGARLELRIKPVSLGSYDPTFSPGQISVRLVAGSLPALKSGRVGKPSGQRHLRRMLAGHRRHDSGHRAHQPRGQRPGTTRDAAVPGPMDAPI